VDILKIFIIFKVL